MGKKFLKLGRKPKRQLNPMEKYRHQIKEKQRLKSYIQKLNSKKHFPEKPQIDYDED